MEHNSFVSFQSEDQVAPFYDSQVARRCRGLPQRLQIFVTSYGKPPIRNDNEILHADQTRREAIFIHGRTRMVSRDLFPVAYVLVFSFYLFFMLYLAHILSLHLYI